MEADGYREKEPSETMLYVSNLPFSFDDEKLSDVFSDFTVEGAYVATRRNGRSKGFGFVNFSTHEEQQKALEAVDGQELDGRTLTVKVAHKDERRNERGELKEEFRKEVESRSERDQASGGGSSSGRRGAKKTASETVLYVSNLPFSFEDEDLSEVFGKWEVVSARIARRRNGRSKGFGFVEFQNKTDQTEALEEIHGLNVQEREIAVKVSMVADPSAPTSNIGSGGKSGGTGRRVKSSEPSETTLYVSNLPFSLTDEQLASAFSDKGLEVVNARIAVRKNGKSKGFGFVEFSSNEEQQRALAEDGIEIEERVLSVKVALKDSETKPDKRASKAPSQTVVYVSNLPFKTTDEDLAVLFEGLNVSSARVAKRKNGKSKGFGFVEFASQEDQQQALQKNEEEYESRPLTVEVAMTDSFVEEEEEAPEVEAAEDEENNNNAAAEAE